MDWANHRPADASLSRMCVYVCVLSTWLRFASAPGVPAPRRSRGDVNLPARKILPRRWPPVRESNDRAAGRNQLEVVRRWRWPMFECADERGGSSLGRAIAQRFATRRARPLVSPLLVAGRHRQHESNRLRSISTPAGHLFATFVSFLLWARFASGQFICYCSAFAGPKRAAESGKRAAKTLTGTTTTISTPADTFVGSRMQWPARERATERVETLWRHSAGDGHFPAA